MVLIRDNIRDNIRKSIRDNIQPRSFFDLHGGASAGYSLYDLGNRRGVVTETGETVYGDFVTYESDFSAGKDGWFQDTTGSLLDGNVDGIGGKDDCLRYTIDSLTVSYHQAKRNNSFRIGSTYRVTGEFYIPSSNADLDGISVGDSTLQRQVFDSPTLDAWVEWDFIFTPTQDNTRFQAVAYSGGNRSFTGNGTDVFYIRNVIITELDTYRTLDVAYYNPAVRLRRDSDNIHKSFPAGAFTQMQNWANEDVETYASDFSAGVDGNTAKSGTVTGNVDSIGGEDDNLSFWADGSTTTHGIVLPQSHFISGNQYLLSVDVYIPSANTNVDKAGIYFSGSSTVPESTNTTDAWVTLTYQFTYGEGNNTGAVRVTQQVSTNNPNYTFTGANSASDDLIYIRNVRITQLTSNAYATTWYDQSGVSVTSTPHDSAVDGWGDYTQLGTTNTANYDSGDAGHDSCLRIESNDGSFDRAQLALPFDVDDVIRITLDYKSVSGAGNHLISSDGSPTLFTGAELVSTEWDTVSTIITVTSAITTLRFYSSNVGTATDELLIDNIKVEVLDKAHNDAIQTTADNQPKVVDAGVLVTDDYGNYSIWRDKTTLGHGLDLTTQISGDPTTVFAVSESIQNASYIGSGNGDSTATLFGRRSTSVYTMRGTSTLLDGGAYSDNPVITTWLFNTTNSEIWADGVNEVTGVSDTLAGVGFIGGAGSSNPIKISAIIIYASDQSANRSAIEQSLSNILTTPLS